MRRLLILAVAALSMIACSSSDYDQPQPTPRRPGGTSDAPIARCGGVCQPVSANPAPTVSPSRSASSHTISPAWLRQSTKIDTEACSRGIAAFATSTSSCSSSSAISLIRSTQLQYGHTTYGGDLVSTWSVLR